MCADKKHVGLDSENSDVCINYMIHSQSNMKIVNQVIYISHRKLNYSKTSLDKKK